MDIALGLPISDAGRLVGWARRAETCGFSALGLLDRLTFDNPEPLTALAVLAGATERIHLQTEVLLGPLRQTALLAKQVATLDRMSGGRFSLGIGVGGGRADDHSAAGVPVGRRGSLLDRQLAELRQIWNGQPYSCDAATDAGAVIGPRPLTAGGPPILIGGFASAALARVARFGDGFLCAAPIDWAGPLVTEVRDHWSAAGRTGSPRLVCQINVAIGPASTVHAARDSIADYYAFTGKPGWGAPLTTAGQITDAVAAYREFGADELVLYCYAADSNQIEMLDELVR